MPRFFRAIGAAFRAVIGPCIAAYRAEMGWKTHAERDHERDDASLLRQLLPPDDFQPEPQDEYRPIIQRGYSLEYLRRVSYLRYLNRVGRLPVSISRASYLVARYRAARRAA